MSRTQTKTTSFADRLVEWFVPDREAMAKAIHKLLWEKGNGGPLPLGKLEHKSETGLRALIRYMSYRVGGYHHKNGNSVIYRAPYFTARWVRGQGSLSPEGSLSVTWSDIARHVNEQELADCTDPFQLADALCEVLRTAAQLIDDPSAL